MGTPKIGMKIWMQAHGLKAEEAAAALAISRSHVYRHLAGRQPEARTVRLMEAYDLEPRLMRELVGIESAEELEDTPEVMP